MAKCKDKRSYEFESWESNTKTGKYVRIANDMQDSAAWEDLSCFAVRVYLLMKKKYNKNNADDISLTYKEAGKYMNARTFTKSIDELIEHGFIKIVRQSWTSRECNIYAFSENWKRFGTTEFLMEPRRKRAPASTNMLGRKFPKKQADPIPLA